MIEIIEVRICRIVPKRIVHREPLHTCPCSADRVLHRHLSGRVRIDAVGDSRVVDMAHGIDRAPLFVLLVPPPADVPSGIVLPVPPQRRLRRRVLREPVERRLRPVVQITRLQRFLIQNLVDRFDVLGRGQDRVRFHGLIDPVIRLAHIRRHIRHIPDSSERPAWKRRQRQDQADRDHQPFVYLLHVVLLFTPQRFVFCHRSIITSP